MTINKTNAKKIAKKLGFTVDAVVPIFEKIENADLGTQLKNALSALPVPRAFSESKIILRNLYAETHEEQYLKLLYKLAVIDSFCIEPYSKIAECPTFNILAMAFKKLNTMSFDWNVYGYEKLLLSKTDIKNMLSLWGEPAQHSTLNEKENDLYKVYEKKTKTAIIL